MKALKVASILLLFSMIFVIPVFAAPALVDTSASAVYDAPNARVQVQEPEPVDNPAVDFFVKLIFGLTLTLPGATALGTVIVNILKIPGWVKEDKAVIASNVVSVLFALFIGFASLFTAWDIPGLDVKFSALASTLTVLLPAFLLLYKWLAPIFYSVFRGVWGIGYSHTLAKHK